MFIFGFYFSLVGEIDGYVLMMRFVATSAPCTRTTWSYSYVACVASGREERKDRL